MELADKIRAALDAETARAQANGGYGPDDVLRMVTAHRKILDLLPAVRAMQEKISEEWNPGEPVGEGEAEAILAALAEYYEVEDTP